MSRLILGIHLNEPDIDLLASLVFFVQYELMALTLLLRKDGVF